MSFLSPQEHPAAASTPPRNRNCVRLVCTMQVCTVAYGNTARIGAAVPSRPLLFPPSGTSSSFFSDLCRCRYRIDAFVRDRSQRVAEPNEVLPIHPTN